ncbi:MAG: hypothetical protein OES46_21320, partial [Gammaproteobacteria bacterium]|nr:hypothetical protein [Gammaproteobacteria bacterium]
VVAGVTVAAAMSWAAFANAQLAGADNESESDEPGAPAETDAKAPTGIPEEQSQSRVMDEIKVIADPQGRTAFELEMHRQALMREAVYAEMRMRERREEESAWRQADRDLKNPESRIKWGYSPQAEQRMRRENDYMYDLPIDETKPASIFRVEF